MRTKLTLKRRQVVAVGVAMALGMGLGLAALPSLLTGNVAVAAEDKEPPTIPADVKVSEPQPTKVTVSWSESTDNIGVFAYDIFHDGNRIGVAEAPATSAEVTGLTPNTKYRITVFARDAAGNVSESSESVEVTTPASDDTDAPAGPTGLTVTGTTADSISLTWTAPADAEGPLTYSVFNGDEELAKDLKETKATLEKLLENTEYKLTVRAIDEGGNQSAPSNEVTAKTVPGEGDGDDGDGGDDGGTAGNPGSAETVAKGFSIPWGIDWLPDGSALVGERDSFKVFKVGQDGQKTEAGEVPDVETTDGEGGLLGIAVSPKFATDKTVFIYHTAQEGNQIVSMTFDGTKLTGEPKLLVDGIKKKRFHNGGRIKFGPDGNLYATTGDAQQEELAQDEESLNGKILRMTPEGKPVEGNLAADSLVYSYGHRNPQGLAWDSEGRLWSSEFGNSKQDELNLIEAGKNYGWGAGCEGRCNKEGMTDPQMVWSVGEASPSGIAIVGDVVYMGALRGERLWQTPIKGGKAGDPKGFFVNDHGRLRTVEKVPGKNQIWMSTSNADNNGEQPDGSDEIFKVDIK